MSTIETHLKLARVSNTPTVLSNLVLGVGVAGAASFEPRFAFAALAAFLFYTAGMYLNDYFDAEHDAESQLYRPIPNGEISKSLVGKLGFLQLVVACLLLIPFGFISVVLGVSLASCIVVYDYYHKEQAWTMLAMAGSRALVYVIGASLVGLSIPWVRSHIIILAVLLGIYVLGLTWIARRAELGDVLPVVPVVVIFIPVVLLAIDWNVKAQGGLFWMLPVASLLWTFLCIYWIQKNKMGRGIGGLIAGIALFDAMILATRAPLWATYFCLLMFLLTLVLQRFVRGT